MYRPANINIGFTCLDQLDEPVGICENDELIKHNSSDFIKRAIKYFKNAIPQIGGFFGTFGLTRDEFEEF